MVYIATQFKNHLTLIQIAIFAAVISTLWIAETKLPLSIHRTKLKHALPNLLFILTGLPVQLSISIVVIMLSHWTVEHHWGLLFHLPFLGNIWIKYIFGFLLLDLLDYLYHIIMHKTKILWKFHQIHHSDFSLDVSTTLREHPIETFVRVSFLALWVFISGASFGLLIIRQSLQTISNIIAHTEARLPLKTERFLGIFLVTPHSHAIHHHYKLPYTDSNYGDVLCIWDRLFGTYMKLEKEDIKYGLDVFEQKNTKDFLKLIAVPFVQQEDSNSQYTSSWKTKA